MFSAEVPQDIRKFKMKTVASLSLRQLICIILCIVIDLVLYTSFLKELQLGTQGTVFALFFSDILFLAIGFVEIMEMPLERFLLMYVWCNILSPPERKAGNPGLLEEKTGAVKKKPLKRKELKKHPEYIGYR